MNKYRSRHPSAQELRHFRLFDAISDERLELLAKSLTLSHGHRRKKLLAIGDRSDFSLLLFEGELLLVDASGQTRHLRADRHLAVGPVSDQIPRLHDVICLSDVLYLKVGNRELRAQLHAQKGEVHDPGTEMVAGDPLLQGKEMVQRIRDDLRKGCLALPSLPDVALRIGRAMDDENTDAQRIASIIQNDPAMTAKLIWVANTACYFSRENTITCAQAVMRLGFKTTYQLVLSFALKEVFHNLDAALMKRAQDLWRHSVHVAALCFVLARRIGRFDPEVALLCGLLHDIGVIPILHYAGEFPALSGDTKALSLLERQLRGEIGAQVLREWHFPETLVRCALEADNWSRETKVDSDYCDLVIVAQMYAAMGSAEAEHLPVLNEVPAYQRLEIGDVDAMGIPEVLRDAGDELAQAEEMLGS